MFSHVQSWVKRKATILIHTHSSKLQPNDKGEVCHDYWLLLSCIAVISENTHETIQPPVPFMQIKVCFQTDNDLTHRFMCSTECLPVFPSCNAYRFGISYQLHPNNIIMCVSSLSFWWIAPQPMKSLSRKQLLLSTRCVPLVFGVWVTVGAWCLFFASRWPKAWEIVNPDSSRLSQVGLMSACHSPLQMIDWLKWWPISSQDT